jgi:hypothetical protein
MSSDGIVGEINKDDENATDKKIIDAELKEAMERLGKNYSDKNLNLVYCIKLQVTVKKY